MIILKFNFLRFCIISWKELEWFLSVFILVMCFVVELVYEIVMCCLEIIKIWVKDVYFLDCILDVIDGKEGDCSVFFLKWVC